jgi:hypothetical protein
VLPRPQCLTACGSESKAFIQGHNIKTIALRIGFGLHLKIITKTIFQAKTLLFFTYNSILCLQFSEDQSSSERTVSKMIAADNQKKGI